MLMMRLTATAVAPALAYSAMIWEQRGSGSDANVEGGSMRTASMRMMSIVRLLSSVLFVNNFKKNFFYNLKFSFCCI